MGRQCEQLEAEQRELVWPTTSAHRPTFTLALAPSPYSPNPPKVRAFDDLSRVNGALRRQLRQQSGEAAQLREASRHAQTRSSLQRQSGPPTARGALPLAQVAQWASEQRYGHLGPAVPHLESLRGAAQHFGLPAFDQSRRCSGASVTGSTACNVPFWWRHSSLAWPLAAGSPGFWLRYALQTSGRVTQGPMRGGREARPMPLTLRR